MSTCLLWFRQDLRLADHPALATALEQATSLVPVFIWDPQQAEHWGAAQKVWLHHSLSSLAESLRQRGSDLILRVGESQAVLSELAAETQAKQVCWQRAYDPLQRAGDEQISTHLQAQGLNVAICNGGLLFEPEQIHTQSGGPYKVFTPFWRRCLDQPSPAEALPAPDQLPPTLAELNSDSLASLGLLPEHPWQHKISQHWQAGEPAAQQQLLAFAEQVAQYAELRNFPGQAGSSRLSPYLHFGEISPRQVWQTLAPLPATEGKRVFLSEIGWREFAHHILYHFPETLQRPLDVRFEKFKWETDPAGVRAWQRGLTGYPIVDAGMRELWQTGWMHNRVRMIVASFLSKNLLVHWQAGADWFWDTLVDADLANNTLNWQWVAGCGADAAPFFRIFNPVTQGQKFDPQGLYIRKWLPELQALPDKWLFAPWQAPAEVLAAARIRLGVDYPEPLMDHAEARERALQRFAALKQAAHS